MPLPCNRCDGKGLIRVEYHSGDAYDVAICQCRAGRFWRQSGPDVVRACMANDNHGQPVTFEHQIALLEDFEGEAPAPVAKHPAWAAAGKVGKKAKL